MTNYKSFYNAWSAYSKPQKILLLEQEKQYAFIVDKMDPKDFLDLTTDEETFKSLIDKPSIGEPFKRTLAGTLSLTVQIIKKTNGKNIAKVIAHEGRNRSVAAMKIGAPVEVGIKIFPEMPDITVKDIYAFKSQLKNKEIKTQDLLSRGNMLKHPEPAYDLKDPLGVDETGQLTLSGYSSELISIDANKKIQNYINLRYLNHPQVQTGALMKTQFIQILNNLYNVVDNTGQKYVFEFADVKYHIDAVTKQKIRSGMKTFNLNPNPVELYGSEEAANTKTYIITRK